LTRAVVFRPRAISDLEAIHDDIEQENPAKALRFLARIGAFCMGLGDFPERGTERSEVGAGLRIVGFERRATIVFSVSADEIEIARVLYGGRDFERILQTELL